MELGPRHITSNVIAPGFFPSKLAQGLIKNLGGEEELSKDNPMGRLGAPEDIAGVALFLSSPSGRYVYVMRALSCDFDDLTCANCPKKERRGHRSRWGSEMVGRADVEAVDWVCL